jgi:hypothetical protein
MKYLATLTILLFLISSNEILQAQWIQTNGPYGGIVNCLAVSGTNLFAGTDNGVFLSTNNESSWTAVNNGFPSNPQIVALTDSGTNIFAGIKDRVYFSTNNGTNWTAFNHSFDNYYLSALAVYGTNLIAGTSGGTSNPGGVYLSTDNGTSWGSVLGGGFLFVISLNVSGTNCLAGTDNGAFLSTDNGTSWTIVNNGLTNFYVTAFAGSGTNLFAGTQRGVYLSTNNGTSWTAVNDGFPSNPKIGTLVVNGSNIFAGTNGGGVYLSTNNGSSWTIVNSGLTNYYVTALAISGTNIFAGTQGAGVWKRPLSDLTAVTKEINDSPKDYILAQNYPNPFNPSTLITYSLPSSSNVKLVVYNTLGQSIKIIDNEYKQAGSYSINFNASDLPSGIYFYKLEAGQFSQIKKMILIK